MRTAKLRSDWADAQADLNLRWAHMHFVGFVITWLIYQVIPRLGPLMDARLFPKLGSGWPYKTCHKHVIHVLTICVPLENLFERLNMLEA